MQSINKQSGAVLLIGIIMVLVLSVLVLTASKSTVLQQKMSSNLRDKELSFQSAESALREAEAFISSSTQADLSGVFGVTDGLYVFDKNRVLNTKTAWENAGINPLQSSSNLFQVSNQANYIIEQLPPIKSAGESLIAGKPIISSYYRVSANAQGGTDSSLTILQTIYKKLNL